jgi:hypothetical protein
MIARDASLSDGEEVPLQRRGILGNMRRKSAAKRMAVVVAILSGISFFSFLPEKEIHHADAFQFDGDIAAKKEVCALKAEKSFLRSLDGKDEDYSVSAEDDGCAEILFGVENLKNVSEKEFEMELRTMVAGYPIEAMLPAIVKYDRNVAALLVGIAKKESDWGKHVPVDDAGSDCFNYWGYKGAGARGVEMGHGCFGTPEEAVRMVGDRIVVLSTLRTTAPEKMVVWKCGSSCAWDNPDNVKKWIADVHIYYDKIARL